MKTTQTPGIEEIFDNKTHVATVIRSSFKPASKNGVHFFNQNADPLQIGMLTKKAGDIAKPHVHVCKPLTITEVFEIIIVISGKIKFTMYSIETDAVLTSVILNPGDKIIHKRGGHGLEYLEDSEIFEVKQGPYDESTNYKRFIEPKA